MAEAQREWSPRFWNGADAAAWLRILAGNRFAVEPAFWYIAVVVTGKSLLNTGLRWLQEGRYADALKRPPTPPLIVLGHWRTGTTLLHELLALDDRFASPTTLHCFEPCQHLLTGEFFRTRLNFLLPSKRPMDNMPAGWDRPQEDEFALALLGQPSTYADVAFSNRPPLFPGSLDLSGVSLAGKRRWVRTLRRFAAAVAVRDRRPLILKSPPHTARIPELLAAFPEAKFVHIRRDPYTLFASTVKLWTEMARAHGFQKPRDVAGLEEKVFREFRVIYERYFATRELIPASRLVEVRYEELVTDLVGGVEQVYAGLGLGGWAAVRPKVQAYADRSRGYETNKFQMDATRRARIRERWSDLIERLGYGERSSRVELLESDPRSPPCVRHGQLAIARLDQSRIAVFARLRLHVPHLLPSPPVVRTSQQTQRATADGHRVADHPNAAVPHPHHVDAGRRISHRRRLGRAERPPAVGGHRPAHLQWVPRPHQGHHVAAGRPEQRRLNLVEPGRPADGVRPPPRPAGVFRVVHIRGPVAVRLDRRAGQQVAAAQAQRLGPDRPVESGRQHLRLRPTHPAVARLPHIPGPCVRRRAGLVPQGQHARPGDEQHRVPARLTGQRAGHLRRRPLRPIEPAEPNLHVLRALVGATEPGGNEPPRDDLRHGGGMAGREWRRLKDEHIKSFLATDQHRSH